MRYGWHVGSDSRYQKGREDNRRGREDKRKEDRRITKETQQKI